MKISMRLSVASMVLFLILTMSTLILIPGYFALNKILLVAVNHNLKYAIDKIGQQIDEYFLPLTTANQRAFELFNNKTILPEQSDAMIQLLHATNRSEDNLSGAIWYDASDDFFYVSQPRESNNIEEIQIFGEQHGNKTIQKIYAKNGQLIHTETINKALFYTKPWYQKAINAKKNICVIFNFAPLGSQKTQLGVASAFPVYNDRGGLLGIFGVNMLIDNINTYINNLTVTKNSLIFIINNLGEVMQQLGTGSNTTNPANNHALLKRQSLAIYQKTQQTISAFTWQGKKYLTAYEKIAALKTDNTWFVAIITPMDDVMAPLRAKIFIDLILIIAAIIIGLLLTSLFSTRVSAPIKALAQDLHLICNLKLNRVKGVISIIKEVAEMNDAFMRMKNALASFQRYIPLALVKKLITSNKVAMVGGENQELSIIFTDIKDFIPFAENMAPQKLTRYLSSYLQVLTKIIIDTDGTIDKYMNGSVMAFWGAPLADNQHALHACQAALAIQQALTQFNQAAIKSGAVSTTTYIGINTGRVVVGNMGSDDRLNYTAIGDNVNLTSRIKALNQIYQAAIIISEHTYLQVKDQFKLRFLDKVLVKGKHHGIGIYELVGNLTTTPDIELEQYNQEFLLAFTNYEQGNWQLALDLFIILDKKYQNYTTAKIFIERCLLCLQQPPKNWHGFWEIDTK